MLAPNRYRDGNDVVDLGGQAYSLYPEVLGDYPQGNIAMFRRMWDTVGFKHEDNYLFAEKRDVSGWASGQVSHYYRCSKWAIADAFYSWSIPDPGGIPSNSEASLRAIKNSLPGRPVVDLPVFAFELRDLPRMVKQSGDLLRKGFKTVKERDVRHFIGGTDASRVANANLAIQFGWAPFISDLTKMVGLTNDVEKRINEFDRLYSDTGLSRSLGTYGSEINIGESGHYIGPPYSNETALSIQYEARLRQWVSLNYRPLVQPPWKDDDEKRLQATRLVTGLSQRPAILWEAMPWSWLADWFGNLGDYIASNDNSVPVTLTRFSVMFQAGIFASKSSFYEGYNPYGATFRLNKDPVYVQKTRTPILTPPSPSYHLPFLSGKQSSILSSLAVQKFRR